MRQIYGIIFLLVIFAGVIIPSVNSAPPPLELPPLNPADLTLKENPAEPGASAMYLYREEYINDKVPGRVFEEYNYRLKVFTEEGRKYANVEVVYIKGFSDVRDVHGRTIHPDGTVIEFKGQVNDKTVIKAGEFKIQIKSFLLPDVTPGSVIEYGFKSQFSDVRASADWHVQDELFTRKAHFAFLPYGGQTTASLLWRSIRLPNVQPVKQSDGSWALDLENIPGLPEENNMLPVEELRSRLEFFYTRTQHTQDAQEYWNRIAKTWNETDDKFIGNRGSIRGIAMQTVGAGDTPEEKLRKLYVRAQQIHNLTYDPEKTTQEEKREKTIENNSVEDVLKHGSAGKYNINRFFVALARAAGFEAQIAWVRARTNSFFHLEMQEASELNESLAYVKAGDKEYYLDPGNIFCPFGMLPWYETSTAVFRPSKEGAVFETVPDSPSSSSLLERRVQLTLDPEGSLSGTMTVRWAGQRAFIRRFEELNDDEVARKKLITDEINGWMPAGAKFELTSLTNWEKNDQPLEAQGRLSLPGMGQMAGKRLLLPIGLYLSTQRQAFDASKRKQDIYFPYLYETMDDMTIQLPAGWQPQGMPTPRTMNPGGGLRYEISAKLEGGAVHVQRKLVVAGMLLPADLYPEIRSFFHSAKINDDQQLVLQPASSAKVDIHGPVTSEMEGRVLVIKTLDTWKRNR